MDPTTKKILIGLVSLLVVIAIIVIIVKSKKSSIVTKEPYAEMFYAKDYAKGNWVSRPDFKADLSPRFDATRNSGGNILGSFPGMQVQGAPLTPVENIMSVSTPSYATMGGPNGAYTDPRLPAGGLSTTQVNSILSNKFGRGTPGESEYLDPKQLLPIPDMKSSMARDPSDPNTFMYDRYLFAPLKRRYGNVGVDRIRGDLAIPQLRMGWFDPAPVAKQDLTAGYFSDFLDIQQATALRDSIFERKPTPVQQASPFGRLGEETIYSIL
jgi:hypothetical protein